MVFKTQQADLILSCQIWLKLVQRRGNVSRTNRRQTLFFIDTVDYTRANGMHKLYRLHHNLVQCVHTHSSLANFVSVESRRPG